MDRCWLQAAVGDVPHALSCAAGQHPLLLRAIARLVLAGPFCALLAVITYAIDVQRSIPVRSKALASARKSTRKTVPAIAW